VTLAAVFLDAGNTIVSLDYELIARLLRARGLDVEAPAVRDAEPRARVRLDPHLATRGSTESADVFSLYVRYVLEALGLPAAAADSTLVQALREANPPLGLWSVPMPGAPTALAALRRLGLRLAVVSNSNGSVASILSAVGLSEHLDLVVDSGVVGVEKPDPRIFHHAARALGIRPADAVHVGDLYSVDVVGARAAGSAAILLDPAGAWPVTDCPKAPDLTAAVRLIEAMVGR
jgi:putative hydrolase of the HAD superfamily